MADTTAKRGLYKPDREDFVGVVADINNNMDNLDDALPDNVLATYYDDLEFPVLEGTKCYYEGHYYIANQDINNSEDFIVGHWDEVTVSDLIDELQGEISEILSLPTVTSSDNGKIMRVVNGAWELVEIPSASGENF